MPAEGTTRREPWNPLLKSYPFSEKVNMLSIGAETLFTRLIAQADDYGNYYGNPRMILAGLFPHRWANKEMSETDAGRWRAELVTCPVGPLAALYTVNGTEYIHLLNPRRRFRADVTPEERFPREPENIEGNALSEYVSKTARKRPADVPLDRDPTETKTKTETKKRDGLSSNDSYSPDFETFWAEFLAVKRGVGKIEAWKAWKTTLKGRPGDNGHRPVTAAELILAAHNYRQGCEQEHTEPKYIKRPATFLGPDRHWEDHRELPASSGSDDVRDETLRPQGHDDEQYETWWSGGKSGDQIRAEGGADATSSELSEVEGRQG